MKIFAIFAAIIILIIIASSQRSDFKPLEANNGNYSERTICEGEVLAINDYASSFDLFDISITDIPREFKNSNIELLGKWPDGTIAYEKNEFWNGADKLVFEDLMPSNVSTVFPYYNIENFIIFQPNGNSNVIQKIENTSLTVLIDRYLTEYKENKTNIHMYARSNKEINLTFWRERDDTLIGYKLCPRNKRIYVNFLDNGYFGHGKDYYLIVL
jgi:hypothetical protein